MSRVERLAKGIYWDWSWNPFTGCSSVGDGCLNCWARRTAKGRLRGRYGYPADEPFRPTFHPDRLGQVNSRQKPQVIAVCFMSDPFHEKHMILDIFKMLEVVVRCPQHTFIILTKRPQYMGTIINDSLWRFLDGKPIPNLIGGVSIWDQESADRMIPILLQTNLATRIVSLEPALGIVDIEPYLIPEGHCLSCGGEATTVYRGEHWVGPDHEPNAWEPCGPVSKGGIDGLILGGESGPGARPMHPDIPRSVRDQCRAAGVPFFFKQWGEWLHLNQHTGQALTGNHHWWGHDKLEAHDISYRIGKKAASRILDGRTWDELPEVLR